MQSETEESIVEHEAREFERSHTKIFRVYEEYSGRKIGETIRTRRESFNKANLDARREQQTEVNREVEDFCTWLEETRHFEPSAAHYYSVSLKSLLLGLPAGLQVACLFGIILDTWIREPSGQ